MEFASYGYEVYTPEVDDHGVDFVAKAPDTSVYYEIQVKNCRKVKYIYETKEKMPLSNTRLMVVLNFIEGQLPTMYIIPTMEWKHPNEVLVDRNYDKSGQTSEPEWGINMSQKNLPYLEQYKAEKFLDEVELNWNLHKREPQPLTNEMVKDGILKEAQFIQYSEDGAMGSDGEIMTVQKNGEVYVGNYANGELSIKQIMEAFPWIGSKKFDEIVKNGISNDGKVHYYYLECGNHLFVRDTVDGVFQEVMKKCRGL
jgi:hypothetical protein